MSDERADVNASKTVGVIGCGKMGGALAEAFVKAERVHRSGLILHDKRRHLAEAVAQRTGGHSAEDGRELCNRSQIVFLAVKPQDLSGLLADLGEALAEPETFVSIAAGVELATIRRAVGEGCNLVRAMPNRPALVGAGVTALMGDEGTAPESVDEVERLLRSAGQTVRLNEEAQFDAVTALSGSGPAFVFSLVESLEAGGVACGLDPETARALAVATVHGAGRLLMELNTSPEAERIAVSSPGGTTVAGLAVLARRGFDEAVVAAVTAAAERSAELGRQLAEEGGDGQ